MMATRQTFVSRIYRLLLWLLPPETRRADGEEMLHLFARLWADDKRLARRFRLLAGSWGRLPLVALTEWTEKARGSQWLPQHPWELARHAHLACRSLTRSPGFAIMSVVLIGLGIGSTTAVFTLIDHVLLRPLPYPQPERLLFVQDSHDASEGAAHPGPVIREMQRIEAVDQWAIARSRPANLTGEGHPLRVTAGTISVDFFDVFGAAPALGRLFQADDFVAADRVVLSYDTWAQHFGGDPKLIGKTVRLEDQPMTVIGVLEPTFAPPQALVDHRVDVWRPIDWRLPVHQRIDAESLEVVARLARGVTIEAAQAQLDVVAAEMAQRHPDRYFVDSKVAPLPLVSLHERTVRLVRSELYLLFGAVALLLLIAALNVAHLFLARGFARVGEMAVRRSLGASSATLVRQLLTESLVVAAAGCLIGVALAYGGLAALLYLDPSDLPIGGPITIDLPVLAFAVAASCATALLFGLAPALRSTGERAVAAASRASAGATPTQRLRQGLVVAEVALTLLMVTQAGLLVRSFLSVHANDAGLDPQHVITMQLRDPAAEDIDGFVRTMRTVRQSLEAEPAVASAGFGINLPFELTGGRRGGWSNRFEMVADGQRRERILLRQMPVSPTYFDALGIPMLGGRTWTEAETLPRTISEDEARPPVPVILSQNTAEHFFGDFSRATGRTLHHADAPERIWRVIGVVGNVRHWGLDEEMPHGLYLPTSIMPHRRRAVSMAVRFRGAPPADAQEALRAAVWRVAPDVPVAQALPMTAWIRGSTADRRFDSLLFGSFASAGLLLAGAGVYASLLFFVGQRRREMGIRLALGATARTVQRHVLAAGLRLAAMGLVIGLVASFWGGRLLESRLYGVGALDPYTLAIAACVLLVTVIAASWLPARRASRSDPQEVLRAE